MHLSLVTYLVDDYDKAIRWFVDVLGFTLAEDSPQGNGKRWVVVCPPDGRPPSGQTALLLAQAATSQQSASIGQQGGGRVFLFLHTANFWETYQRYRANGVHFCEEPRHETYGMVVVFEDLYGTRWDLLGSP
ncbi:MAG TPA: VOC family protein [Anaerolineales bacterium]|nr:VOC family protein [Anaerolineales bacterium]